MRTHSSSSQRPSNPRSSRSGATDRCVRFEWATRAEASSRAEFSPVQSSPVEPCCQRLLCTAFRRTRARHEELDEIKEEATWLRVAIHRSVYITSRRDFRVVRSTSACQSALLVPRYAVHFRQRASRTLQCSQFTLKLHASSHCIWPRVPPAECLHRSIQRTRIVLHVLYCTLLRE